MIKVPFNKPYTSGQESVYIEECIKTGQISGNGPYTQRVQEFMENKFACSKILLTTSCTAALEMAALLIELQPGDEVIMPSFTFVSTANAVLLRGARPVFADIEPGTLNINPTEIEKKINPRTRAVIVVHYAGAACNMDEIMRIAGENDLKVIEDAAQAVNARYRDKYLGTIGDIGCYSFHATKNYTCGEGGAILINCLEQDLIQKAEFIWEKGTNRSSYLKGKVNKYEWVSVGSSYLPSEILAAFLQAQLKQLDVISGMREKIYRYYLDNLKDFAAEGLIKLPVIPQYAKSNYHIFYILFNTEDDREYVRNYLNNQGIEAVFHYLPLHTSPMGRKLGYCKGDLEVTEQAGSTLLRLPLYPHLTVYEQDYILENLRAALQEVSG